MRISVLCSPVRLFIRCDKTGLSTELHGHIQLSPIPENSLVPSQYIILVDKALFFRSCNVVSLQFVEVNNHLIRFGILPTNDTVLETGVFQIESQVRQVNGFVVFPYNM